MRDSRLPPRPEPMPAMPPGLFTMRRMSPLFAWVPLLFIYVRYARYDAQRGYDFSLFMQCLCVIANCWVAFIIARGCWRDYSRWRDIRKAYDGMLDDLDVIALTHLKMLEEGIETPEGVDYRLTEAAERLDEHVRRAFHSQRIRVDVAGRYCDQLRQR